MRFMARQSLAVAVMKLKFQSACGQLLNLWGRREATGWRLPRERL